MHITILAHGSRGDVQPYLALGVGLQRAGHQVRLAAPELFRGFVAEYGLEFAPLAGDPRRLMRQAVDKAGAGASLLQQTRVMLDYVLPVAAQVMADARQACQGAQAIVHSMLTCILGRQIALDLGCPDFSALVFAIFARTGAFPNPSFPELPLGAVYNRLTHDIFSQAFWHIGRLAYAWIRRQHPDLPRLAASAWPFDASNPRPTPILYGFSPQAIPKPPDWGEHVHVTGYWFLEAAPGWQPPPDLADFLESGPPPVYIGFGSVITHEAQALTRLALAALAHSGQRGVLQAGWGGLAASDLPRYVFKLDSAPFGWLFPRMTAAVHHGGIGTTAAALRAGIPSVVVPFTADQPFWARRVYRLGVGPPPIPRPKLTAKKLAEAICAVTGDQVIRGRAAEMGGLIRAEDGVARAVEIIERYLGLAG